MGYNQSVIKVPGKPDLHIPRETLNPNKLSGAHIISLVLNFGRHELRVNDFTRLMITKIYNRSGFSYICPQIGEEPPEGYRWILMGTLHKRNVYRAV